MLRLARAASQGGATIRAPRAPATLRRAYSSGHYDSQSGTFVPADDPLRVFEHAASAFGACGALEVVTPVTLASRRIVDSSNLPSGCATLVAPGVSAGGIARVAAVEDVYVARHAGCVGARLDCRFEDRGLAADVAAACAGGASGFSFDVGFTNAAASCDAVAAELVVGELADLSARHVFLAVSRDDVDDDDDLRELVSVLGGIDVVGQPVRRRLGLSAAPDVDADALVALATSLDVLKFDASATGDRFVDTAALLAALDDRGLAHGVDVDALLAKRDA